MELANCIVALGGDLNNTVPKYAVTPAEMLVLQAIHGADAVTDIEKVGDEPRSNKDELQRLYDPMLGYGRAQNNDGKLIVAQAFPGATAQLPKKFDDLDLEDGQWKAERPKRRRPKLENVMA